MQDINLYHLLIFYVKKWPWILALTVLGAAAGFIYNNYIQVPLYKSNATLLIVSSEDRKVGQDSTLLNNYIQLLKSRRVLEPVISTQGYAITYEELADSTVAVNDKGTEVIKVSISSKDPETSKKLVDGVITSFRNEVKKIYNRNNISIVDSASKPAQPYNVRTGMFLLITTIGGLLLSLIILFFTYDVNLTKKKPVRKKLAKAETTPKRKSDSGTKKNASLKATPKLSKAKAVTAEAGLTPKSRVAKVAKTAKPSTRTVTKKQKK